MNAQPFSIPQLVNEAVARGYPARLPIGLSEGKGIGSHVISVVTADMYGAGVDDALG